MQQNTGQTFLNGPLTGRVTSYLAHTKAKVERFNGYLRRSFSVPLASRLGQRGLPLVSAHHGVRAFSEVCMPSAPSIRCAVRVAHSR